MTPLIVIRPQPGCDATVAAARALGLDSHGFPLFALEPRDWAMPHGAFDALLIGSANVFRHGGPGLDALRALPVLAVGEATAEAARSAGFAVGKVGSGFLQDLLDGLPAGKRRLLRLCGEERVAVTAPPGVEIVELPVYASIAQAVTDELRALAAQGAVVMLHSAAAARHLAALDLPRELLALACISARTAAAAGAGWRDVRCAESPDDAALLALAAAMCQEAAGSQ